MSHVLTLFAFYSFPACSSRFDVATRRALHNLAWHYLGVHTSVVASARFEHDGSELPNLPTHLANIAKVIS